MFLRANKRSKNGKEHRYWIMVENRRRSSGQPGREWAGGLADFPKDRVV